MQDRIIDFVADNSKITKDRFKELMLETSKIAKDIGSIIVGEEAVSEGLIDSVGGLDDALNKLYGLIKEKREAVS
jgi:ClpP class serine protease